ncbi:MAG: TrmH family RNA methyltransferase [Vulcanimicrobiaceae bacterium]
MPRLLGAHNARIDYARDLLVKKGRRAHGAFSFEGPTLLEEAWSSGAQIDALYVTQAAFDAHGLVRQIEASGVETYLVDDRTFAKLSDLDTPTGILATGPAVLEQLPQILQEPGVVLVLADLNDPGNAGTLLRSAEAFGVDRVIFGTLGVEPYHPKVVRGAMGAVFRQSIAVATPEQTANAAVEAGWTGIGLAAGGDPLGRVLFPDRTLLVVGNERHGLGSWAALCPQTAAIPMPGRAESLNAAVAGSIALYEATKRLSGDGEKPFN